MPPAAAAGARGRPPGRETGPAQRGVSAQRRNGVALDHAEAGDGAALEARARAQPGAEEATRRIEAKQLSQARDILRDQVLAWLLSPGPIEMGILSVRPTRKRKPTREKAASKKTSAKKTTAKKKSAKKKSKSTSGRKKTK